MNTNVPFITYNPLTAHSYAAQHHMYIVASEGVLLYCLLSLLIGFFWREIIVALRTLVLRRSAKLKRTGGVVAIALAVLLSFGVFPALAQEPTGSLTFQFPQGVLSDSQIWQLHLSSDLFDGEVVSYSAFADPIMLPFSAFESSDNFFTGFNIDLNAFDPDANEVGQTYAYTVVGESAYYSDGGQNPTDPNQQYNLTFDPNGATHFSLASVPEPSTNVFFCLSTLAFFICVYRTRQSRQFPSPWASLVSGWQSVSSVKPLPTRTMTALRCSGLSGTPLENRQGKVTGNAGLTQAQAMVVGVDARTVPEKFRGNSAVMNQRKNVKTFINKVRLVAGKFSTKLALALAVALLVSSSAMAQTGPPTALPIAPDFLYTCLSAPTIAATSVALGFGGLFMVIRWIKKAISKA